MFLKRLILKRMLFHISEKLILKRMSLSISEIDPEKNSY